MQTLEDVQTWRGMKMVDADGDKIGTVEDIHPSGRDCPTLAEGRKHTLVPIRDAEVVGENELRVPLDKEKVKDAPRIEPDGELSPDEERKLWEHYGRSDYDEWQGEDRTRALGLPDEDEDRARQETAPTDAGDDAPRMVGVRLRRVVVIATPVGGPEARRES